MLKKTFASFIFALMLLAGVTQAVSADTKSSADFTDLKDLDAATKAKFDAMISAGIFDGVSESTFGLKDEMNRAQFAKVAALITGIDVDKDLKTSSFSDVKADDAANGYALPYIEAIKTAGITEGFGDGTYNPAGKVTKEQLATFLVRTLGKDADGKAKTGNDTTVSDWAQGYVALALELQLLPAGDDGKFGGQSNATRDLLVTSAYEAKLQYDDPTGKVSIGSAKATGVKKVLVSFNKPIDTSKARLSITTNTVAQAEWASNQRSVTLTLAKKIEKGDYTVTLSGLDADTVDVTTATFTAEDEKVTKLEFVSASDTIAYSKAVAVPFIATNQYGENVEDFDGLDFTVFATSGSPSIDFNNRTIILDTSSPSIVKGISQISINLYENTSRVTVTKVIKVGSEPIVSKIEIRGSLSQVDWNKSYHVNFDAYDQYGNMILPSAYSGNISSTLSPYSDKISIGTGSSASAGPGAYSASITLSDSDKGGSYTLTVYMGAASATLSFSVAEPPPKPEPVIVIPTTEAPTANPASGVVSAGTDVTLSAPGATIYYTTDGSTPTSSSAIYSAPIRIIQNTVVKAIAVKSGWYSSAVFTANYTVATVATPTASIDASTVSLSQPIELSTTTDGATIYYTLNGNTPTINSIEYTAPILLTEDTTIKAIAVKSGYTDSAVMTKSYTVVIPDALPPIFAADYPKVVYSQDPSSKEVEVLVQTNENGTAYYVVIPGYIQEEPSATQIVNGLGADGNPALDDGNVTLVANTEASFAIELLSTGVSYNLYVVASDSAGNFTTPVKQIVTLPNTFSLVSLQRESSSEYILSFSDYLDSFAVYDLSNFEISINGVDRSAELFQSAEVEGFMSDRIKLYVDDSQLDETQPYTITVKVINIQPPGPNYILDNDTASYEWQPVQ